MTDISTHSTSRTRMASRGYDPRWDRYLRGRGRDEGVAAEHTTPQRNEDMLRHLMLEILEPWGSRKLASSEALHRLRLLAEREL